jgi:hypothetical protein
VRLPRPDGDYCQMNPPSVAICLKVRCCHFSEVAASTFDGRLGSKADLVTLISQPQMIATLEMANAYPELRPQPDGTARLAQLYGCNIN